MVKVQGSKFHKLFQEDPKQKCSKFLASIPQKRISLEAIGSRTNNGLLDLFRCRTKWYAKDSCQGFEKLYSSCHASVMGTGNYNGRKHCADELVEWYNCLAKTAADR